MNFPLCLDASLGCPSANNTQEKNPKRARKERQKWSPEDDERSRGSMNLIKSRVSGFKCYPTIGLRTKHLFIDFPLYIEKRDFTSFVNKEGHVKNPDHISKSFSTVTTGKC